MAKKHRDFILAEDVTERSGRINVRDLAYEIENMDYAAAYRFLEHLAQAFQERAKRDSQAGRSQLAGLLDAAAVDIQKSALTVGAASRLCETAEKK